MVCRNTSLAERSLTKSHTLGVRCMCSKNFGLDNCTRFLVISTYYQVHTGDNGLGLSPSVEVATKSILPLGAKGDGGLVSLLRNCCRCQVWQTACLSRTETGVSYLRYLCLENYMGKTTYSISWWKYQILKFDSKISWVYHANHN